MENKYYQKHKENYLAHKKSFLSCFLGFFKVVRIRRHLGQNSKTLLAYKTYGSCLEKNKKKQQISKIHFEFFFNFLNFILGCPISYFFNFDFFKLLAIT